MGLRRTQSTHESDISSKLNYPKILRASAESSAGWRRATGGEDFEFPVDLRIKPVTVDDHVRGGFQGHFLNREGVAQGVLGFILVPGT